MKITLQQIRDLDPCESGLRKLIHVTGGTEDPVDVTRELIDRVGVDDTLWVFARIATPEQRDRFLIRRLDTGEHSALKTLRSLDGDFSVQITAVENVVSLLHRRLAGDDVLQAMRTAADAANAACAAADAASVYATRSAANTASVYATRSAANAADAAYAASVYATHAAADATRAAYAAAVYATHAAARAAAADATHAAARAAAADATRAAADATRAAAADDIMEVLK